MNSIKLFSENGIDTVKANMSAFYEEMKKHPSDSSWIPGLLGLDPFIPSRLSFDFDFYMDDKDPQLSDFENSMRLYRAFQENGLSNAVVFNEKFLVGFTLTKGYRYFIWRMGLKEESRVSGTLFFSSGARRSVARNCVGRLYKLVLLSKEDSASDPFWLTKFAFDNPATARIVYYVYADGENVHLAYFKAMKRWKDKTGEEITGDFADSVRQHLSLLCNINVAEDMDQEDIITYLLDFMIKKNGLDRKLVFEERNSVLR
jgi:hypothetical protein